MSVPPLVKNAFLSFTVQVTTPEGLVVSPEVLQGHRSRPENYSTVSSSSSRDRSSFRTVPVHHSVKLVSSPALERNAIGTIVVNDLTEIDETETIVANDVMDRVTMVATQVVSGESTGDPSPIASTEDLRRAISDNELREIEERLGEIRVQRANRDCCICLLVLVIIGAVIGVISSKITHS